MERALQIQKQVIEILGTDEVYLPIPGFIGLYEVSNLGNVRGVDRRIVHRNNRWGGQHTATRKGVVLSKKLDKYGYHNVNLSKGYKRNFLKVHRLVAEVFIANPDNLPQVNHIDGNKINNIASNLEWVTAKQNIKHSIDYGLRKNAEGESLPQTRLKRDEVVDIKCMLAEKKSQASIAKLYGVNKNTIWHISKGNTWKSV